MQLHGSSYLTDDIDLCYRRSRENCRRIATALQPFSVRPRGIPDDVPFIFDAPTLMSAAVLTLKSDVGDIDLLAEVKGLGTYDSVVAAADVVSYGELRVAILSIDGLLVAKRAAGRPKDEPGIIELEAIKDARESIAG